jgi:hypothetical protein
MGSSTPSGCLAPRMDTGEPARAQKPDPPKAASLFVFQDLVCLGT